jgi:Xaa-Pro aminopeptidase
MQYSPDCAIPTLSLVDSGTVDLIRSLGVDVVSSANLIQQFEATWTEQQIESHFRARNAVDRIRHEAFHLIAHKHRDGVAVTECDVRDFILDQFRRESMITDHGPIVAANAHASDPHFEPSRDRDTEIRRGDFVLIDVWAKLNEPNAVYYDITWTGVCSSTIPSDIQNVFTIVTGARDAAVSFLQSEIRKGNPLAGYQVDDISRGFIDRAGFADKFVHRTGHSIGTDVHGAGANIDNFETHDERRLIPNTCFSIEPGIYLDDFGIRSEVNVLIRASEAEVTGEIQRELVSIV